VEYRELWIAGLSLLGLLTLGMAETASAAQLAKGRVVFEESFDGAEPLKRWRGGTGAGVGLVDGPAGKAACIERPATQGPGGAGIQIPLPVETIRGVRLRCTARVRAEKVAKPPNVWNGVKFMLHLVSPSGHQWLQQNSVHGTFDWRDARFQAWVPPDATEATLILGLEATTGRVWFDDVQISVDKLPRPRPATRPTGPVYKGHDLPRLRGAMIGSHVTAADLEVLAGQWGANHVRWQLIWGGFPHGPADKGDLPAYDAWLEGALKHLDRLLPTCTRLGILVVVDLHTPPGGRNKSNECPLFHEKRFQDKFLEVWEKIARRYRGHKAVWGYDLVNEPVEGFVPDGLMDWQELAEVTAKRVRAIDADHAIIIEPAPWGSPDSLRNFAPIDVPRVVYSVHMYIPHQFTRQGVYGSPRGLAYPGKIGGKRWDKTQLRRALQPVVDFQRDYGVHIYIGEFSAIRWAPGESARDYLRDVIDIMEDNGWDWAYHAFREWSGWSVEHGSDPKDTSPSKTPTSRQKLLQSWYGKNKRPAFAKPGEAKRQ